MKRLVVVRHGETYQNRKKLAQGSDPTYGRLTEKGMEQAALLAAHMADEEFDWVFCSPLERATLTMSSLLMARKGERTLPITFADELKEINLGVVHGKSHTIWRDMVQHDPYNARPPEGESWNEVYSRVANYTQENVLPSPHEKILLVAHGGVNRAIIALLTGISMGDTWSDNGLGAPQENTCINTFEFDEKGNLASAIVNQTAHLIGHLPGAGPGQQWDLTQRRWILLDNNQSHQQNQSV